MTTVLYNEGDIITWTKVNLKPNNKLNTFIISFIRRYIEKPIGNRRASVSIR